MRRVAIIVVCWNNFEDVIDCVQSLFTQSYPGLDVVIVDNNSEQDTQEALTEYLRVQTNEHLHYIQTGDNLGTAGGFSSGITWAIEHEYIYVGALNADAIADSGWAGSLINELERDNDHGIATGLMLRRDGKSIDTTGECFSCWALPGPLLRDAPRERAPKESRDVFGATGGGFIAKTVVFEQIGLFDNAFFMYFEDVDISFRAQLVGWHVRFQPQALVFHKVGASSGKVPGLAVTQTFKNLPMLFIKDVPLSLWPHMLPRFTLTYVLIFGNAVVHGNGWAAFVGWFRSLGLIPHMWSERHRIQSSRKVSDSYINNIILHDIPPEQTGMRKFRKFFTGK